MFEIIGIIASVLIVFSMLFKTTTFKGTVWMRIINLLKIYDEKTYFFTVELASEPFVLKGIQKGEKTIGFVREENDQKVCGCTIGIETFEKTRKDLNLK